MAKKRLSISRVLLLLIMAIIIVFVFKEVGSDKAISADLPKAQESASFISPDMLHSTHAILVSLSDNTILMQKNSDKKIYPTSLTKIMTAIIAIERLPDLQEEITLSNSMFPKYVEDTSSASFRPGERVRVIDLLYGSMMSDDAECCVGLADRIAGSEYDFVKIMNDKASELGMESTHFENSSGLHDAYHYTTVKDLSILLRYALSNDTFAEIFTMPSYCTQPTNIHPGGITFKNNMFSRLGDRSIKEGNIIGGKTGHTDRAGLCLASQAKVGKEEYILITVGAKGDKSSGRDITDALKVYNSLTAE